IMGALSRFEGVHMSSLAESVVYAGTQLLRSIQERRQSGEANLRRLRGNFFV
ncbi:hypothetical protein TrRE_jg11524, partial [Triparma retinervis]